MSDCLQYRGGTTKVNMQQPISEAVLRVPARSVPASNRQCLFADNVHAKRGMARSGFGSGRQLPAISCACFTYGVLGLWLTSPKMGSIWSCTAGHPVPLQWLLSIDYSPSIIPLTGLAGIPLLAAHFLPWCLACTLHHQEHVALPGLCNTISRHSRWWCLTLGHSGSLWG